VHVLGSFIFGLPSDRSDTFDATLALAKQAHVTFAQFVLLTPCPATLDFEIWAADQARAGTNVDGVPITRLADPGGPPARGSTCRIRLTMTFDEIRVGAQRFNRRRRNDRLNQPPRDGTCALATWIQWLF
jgi:hypothetical protein